MPYIGAIHIHSDYSHDGKDPLEQLVDRSVQRGIQFLGMSEHAEDLIPEVWTEYKSHCAALSTSQIAVIPGLEFRFAGLKGVHLLALGLRDWIEPKTPDEFFEATKGNAILTVLAHPVLARYKIPQVVYDRIDAIEVWNGNYNTRHLPDPRSMQIVQTLRQTRPELVATVGLDQHDSSNDRELRLVLPAPTDDPLGEIKAGRHFNMGRTMRIDAHVSVPAAAMRKLTIRRRLFDIVEGMHERIMRGLHRIGVDR